MKGRRLAIFTLVLLALVLEAWLAFSRVRVCCVELDCLDCAGFAVLRTDDPEVCRQAGMWFWNLEEGALRQRLADYFRRPPCLNALGQRCMLTLRFADGHHATITVRPSTEAR